MLPGHFKSNEINIHSDGLNMKCTRAENFIKKQFKQFDLVSIPFLNIPVKYRLKENMS